MTIETNDDRFLKPEIQTLIDIFNITNNSFFSYNELLVYNVKPFVQKYEINVKTDPNTKVTIQKRDSDNSIEFLYKRLDISNFLGPNQIAIEGDINYSNEMLYDYLYVVLGIKLSDSLNSIERPLTNFNDNNEFPIILKPKIENPIWTGEITFNIVPANHIELLIKNQYLNGLVYPNIQK